MALLTGRPSSRDIPSGNPKTRRASRYFDSTAAGNPLWCVLNGHFGLMDFNPMSSVSTTATGGESFADLFAQSLKSQDMKSGEVISAEVVRVDHNFVVVNAGLKSEALIPWKSS